MWPEQVPMMGQATASLSLVFCGSGKKAPQYQSLSGRLNAHE